MARPQFMMVNGKAICIVSTKGVRKKGVAIMKKVIAERMKSKQTAKQAKTAGNKH